MSRYYSLLIFTLLFYGCASKSASDYIAPAITENSINTEFKKDDLYLLYALDAKYREDFTTSAQYFEQLYKIDKNVLYLQEAIKNQILLKKYDEIKRLVDMGLKTYPDNPNLQRFLAAYYLDKGAFKKAKKILTSLIKREDVEEDKALLASTQLGLGEVNKALRYYKKAYNKSKSPKTLLTLANIYYYKLGKTNKAKRLLLSHVDFVGCDEMVCYKLLEIYQKEQDSNALIQIGEKLYDKTKKIQFAKMVLDLYAYEKNYDGAIAFLEKHRIDEAALLELYVLKKYFKKAAKLSKKLYNETGDLHFLAQMAMIEYEASPTPSASKTLQSVQEKFEKVINTLNNPSYNNFYGYILIDHEIDIKKGIKLVKKALEVEPNAPYFIDSLAWGYYKEGQCQKAYDTIYPILNLVNEPEITEHFEKIKACLKGKKK